MQIHSNKQKLTVHDTSRSNNIILFIRALHHQQSHDTIQRSLYDMYHDKGLHWISSRNNLVKQLFIKHCICYSGITNYRQSRQLTSALWRASLTVPQYNIGNIICCICTPHQVKYSDCLHLVFKPINNNVLVLIHLCCIVLILIQVHLNKLECRGKVNLFQ